MKKFLFVALLFLNCSVLAYADDTQNIDMDDDTPTTWFASFQVGGALAFGDDCWDVFDDFKNANGTSLSFSVGKTFNPLLGARLNARYLKLYSRVNLEMLDAYRDKYPDFFPRDGFYGYHAFALQAEAMFNVTNLIPRNAQWFNVYIQGGVGFNTVFGYDKNVENWDGSYEGLKYPVDTRVRTMPTAVLGGTIAFRVCPELSINVEALSTFTGDKLEGVKYEEPYDVYITYSIGATLHF